MAIELNGVNSNTVGESRNRGAAPVSSSTSKATNADNAKPVIVGEKLELSPQARLLNGLEQQVSQLPEVDQQRVDALKQAVQSGQYQIDAEAVARGILAFDRALE